MEQQFLIGTFHLEKQDSLLDILLLPKIFHWNDVKFAMFHISLCLFNQIFQKLFVNGEQPETPRPVCRVVYKYFFCLCVLFTQDAVVIILDVSPSMCQAAPGHATSLETSVKAINMIIQRKVRKFCLTSPRAPGHLIWSK